MSRPVTFSFGENWQSFLSRATAEAFQGAQKDIEEWLGAASVADKTVLDIGSGSGIHSLGFCALKARRIVSFDVDPRSVEATRSIWEKAGKPSHWTVCQGSVLDKDFLGGLGWAAFDIVYAWGVLHHTGALWEAVDNASRMAAPGGRFWVSLYAKGPNYENDLRLKQRYNAASWLGKKIMAWKWIARLMRQRRREGKNPFKWNQRTARGMDTYHDIVDWLGGLPYEVAASEEVDSFLQPKGFKQVKGFICGEGGNHIFVYRREAGAGEKALS